MGCPCLAWQGLFVPSTHLSSPCSSILPCFSVPLISTHQRLNSLLEDARGSLCLFERGDTGPLPRHARFRLIAAMAPPHGDVGRRDLPPALRSRFAEVYVDEAESERELAALATSYLPKVQTMGRERGERLRTSEQRKEGASPTP